MYIFLYILITYALLHKRIQKENTYLYIFVHYKPNYNKTINLFILRIGDRSICTVLERGRLPINVSYCWIEETAVPLFFIGQMSISFFTKQGSDFLMCFIYHFKQARPLFNDSLIHPTNIYHATQEQREKNNKSSLIKPAASSHTWSSWTVCVLWGRKGFVERNFMSL